MISFYIYVILPFYMRSYFNIRHGWRKKKSRQQLFSVQNKCNKLWFRLIPYAYTYTYGVPNTTYIYSSDIALTRTSMCIIENQK